ncbi:polyketide synthase [Muriicola soli]|uniref:Amino acid adenylation domain-containing protein n=1 Tax=Muriicola soli TaxID=2507538 RepID=A0A411E849_9FLAO|nr:polyketide synthase [Muriicola soli]QBA63905.1 amino acid adenylation domain-containing protein [Muriicola soli]
MNPNYTIKGPILKYPNSTLHKLLEYQANENPDAIALEFGEQRISYKRLQESINQSAQYLYNRGLRPGQIVALSLERSPELIISIFAILQCGAGYVPIDVTYPLKRKEIMIDDSDASFIITESLNNSVIKSEKNIFIEELRNDREDLTSKSLDLEIDSNSVAYIIYTSGSTGKPKGVQVSHLNAINLVYSMGDEPGISRNDKIFAVTSISFDAMVMEIYLPLLHGATVVLVDEDTRLDGQKLLEKALEDNITMMWGTPSIWQILLDSGWEKPLKLKALIGGEAVPLNLARKLLTLCTELWNIYGPTETTVCAFLTRISEDDDPIAIGKPVANSYAYILDKEGNPVKQGEEGEIVIGGDGVSLGYLNRPELNDERFINDHFRGNGKMYLSGDIGKILPNGEVQCLGRKDEQIKLRGHRIELGEIQEVLTKLPNIKKCVVILDERLGGKSRILAYLQSSDNKQDTTFVRKQLEEILPDYMIPSIFIWVEKFPVTKNGKIDKKNLPNPVYQRPASAPPVKKPRTRLEKNIAGIWREQLQIPIISIEDNFFEMGGTSILTQKVAGLLKKKLNCNIPVTKIYQFPTVESLSKYVESNKTSISDYSYSEKDKIEISKDIAVIGMSGRFPGANTIHELWEILREGKETTTFFAPEELDKNLPELLRNDPLYVGARGIVPSAKYFDAKFFGINPKLAEAMDPQQRMFLEIAWEALEQSGYLPSHFNGSIGVYAGTGTNTYYKKNVLPNKELLKQVGVLQTDTVNEKDYISSRTAYHLNLKGPAVSVQSACSTSLLAIAEAVQAIRNGQCEIALAGGASLTSPINSGHLYQEGSMLSPDGHCRPFDAQAKGTVFSDGAGVVVLKSLESAEKDGDTIYGVIKGVGVNNDGGNKGSFTAPSAEGQADVIRRAILDANISPSSISYIEVHGTATPLGDPIEFEGLRMAFGEQLKSEFCAIGSIKSNMGHLTAAAGVAGLIKTLLALKHKQIPPSLGFEIPNPVIEFKGSPFYVNDQLNEWSFNGARRAGVSSFGVGGTNVHVVLEEYQMNLKSSDSGRPMQLLTWSAKSQTSLDGYNKSLAQFLANNPTVNMADVCYSLQKTREEFSHRRFAIVNNTSDATSILINNEIENIKSNTLKITPDELAFLYPGQGAQYIHMGRSLYEHEKVYQQAVDSCSEILKEYLKEDIREILFPNAELLKAEEKLKDTRYTQPAIFVTEYALSQLWLSWGIKPTLLCGHSIGEFVAAHLAGIFSLKDALKIVAIRGKLVSELPKGSMLSLRLEKDKVYEILPKGISIAALNSDRLCVVSGPIDEIERFSKILKNKNISHQHLATSHAFHSTMMDPILEEFKSKVEDVSLKVPRIPIVSTVTGKWLKDSEAISSEYWTNHLRDTVRFADAMDTILELDNPILLEVGPGQTLVTLSKQKKEGRSLTALASLPKPKKEEGAYPSLLGSLGQLWLNGITPDWSEFYNEQSRISLTLPSYAFDRKPCWIDPPVSDLAVSPITALSEENINIANGQNNDANLRSNDTKPMRKSNIIQKLSDILNDTAGIELEDSDYEFNFLELGLDSLILTQLATTCKNEFQIPITFRQLNDELNTPDLLAEYLDKNLPVELFKPVGKPDSPEVKSTPTVSSPPLQNYSANINQDSALGLIAQQIELLGKQIALLQGNGTNSQMATPPKMGALPLATNVNNETLSEAEKKEHSKPFGAAPKIEKVKTGLSQLQENFLADLIDRYNRKTSGSKTYSQKHRARMADPRVVSGFKPLTKELVYPIVVEKSAGNRLWDLDGNEYIDTLNGFGSCFFGHQPDFIKKAIQDQVEKGYEVGPQHPLAGEVCELLCEMTGHDRAALCNTGSEAVLGSMRIARTVTGRSLIVAFKGSYHGINDEAIVRGSRKLKTFPAAAGILPGAVQNVLILDYGTEESLAIIRGRAHELAAVLVEPVQSRRPEFVPIDFLKQVRDITKDSGTVLIFDEVITGFRTHPGGAQALFDIRADLATYGKVIGGGLSIGAILGNKIYMDALDGGFWQYGDDSYPEVGVTYFAGTFVRHPLALAACKASLTYLKDKGPELQKKLSDMTEYLANELNVWFKKKNLPIVITHYSSLWRIKFLEEIPYSELLFVLLREKGFHIWDGFPCFITEAYTKEDVKKVIAAVISSLEELIAVEIFPYTLEVNSKSSVINNGDLNTPPVPNARLGFDELGNPAWFVVGENDEYVKIEL